MHTADEGCKKLWYGAGFLKHVENVDQNQKEDEKVQNESYQTQNSDNSCTYALSDSETEDDIDMAFSCHGLELSNEALMASTSNLNDIAETRISRTRGSNMFELDQGECKVLKSEDVLADLEQLHAEMIAICGLPKPICFTLLAQNKWNKERALEKLYSDESTASEVYGAYNPADLERQPTIVSECEICCETNQSFALNCGHYFCYDCWELYLQQKIKNESVLCILCAMQGCKVIADPESIRDILTESDPYYKLYSKLKLKYFTQGNNLQRFCPREDCDLISRAPQSGCWPVYCNCGLVYCFHCGEEWHEPISCEVLKIWIKQSLEDTETYKWINSYTKDCPKCKTPIEKNGGCNHMTCRAMNCRHEFCWICFGDWRTHRDNYSCNRFDDQNKGMPVENPTALERQKARETIDRYLHYFSRYKNHQLSSELEQKLHQRVSELMENLESKENISHVDVTFLNGAVDRLCKARRTLMYTYAFAFYLAWDANSTVIFEDNQSDLERATERLSEMLEKGELEEFVQNEKDLECLRLEMQNISTYVENRRIALLKHCIDGASSDEWRFNREDIKVGTISYGAKAIQ